jgi:hypothetical protein
MKTAVIIRGTITRDNGTFDAQLWNIGSHCKLKVLTVILNPIWPEGGRYRRFDRSFQVTTSLITRPTFRDIGAPLTNETPLMMFMMLVVRTQKVILMNSGGADDYLSINNPSEYCNFTISELRPFPAARKPSLRYFYDVTIHLGIEIPDSHTDSHTA